ncbi:MAG: rod shape-determining protein [Gracilibacteraceae bacterium]|jgi:cell division ATPase FtsA/molybdopterin converting factor small subunit|nr:rod shape-determining protein [Gracilibacteraceae bacterium]
MDSAEQAVFALDIGTRTVIGLVCQMADEKMRLAGAEIIEHGKRAMIDGQVDDIAHVSACVNKVKTGLEEKLNIKLSAVAIAAAGRALRTRTVTLRRRLGAGETITAEILRNLEMEAVAQAQMELNRESGERAAFYCVGHSVSRQALDGYELSAAEGHKGSDFEMTLITAFLPKIVVEGLYAAMDGSGLEVVSLTLEPIAAMNIVIPPELRMLNLALVDIGAGTSDIAVSRAGAVVAYDMATIAGDEITEAIMQAMLVDFATAEKIKQNLTEREEVGFIDILGLAQTAANAEIMAAARPAVDMLVNEVAEKILAINETAPTALFLVGGGSQYPGLAAAFAQKLGMDERRVAVGGAAHIRRFLPEGGETAGVESPEYITPLGIAWTALREAGHNFGTVTVNGKKIRQYSYEGLKVSDVLILSGYYKYEQLVGHMGKPLRYYLDERLTTVSGELAQPAQISLNGAAAALDSPVREGDAVSFIPAVNGADARRRVAEAVPAYSRFPVIFDGREFYAGVWALKNGQFAGEDEEIADGDEIGVIEILTFADFARLIHLTPEQESYWLNGAPAAAADRLEPGDVISSVDPADGPEESRDQSGSILVMLNGKSLRLAAKTGGETYLLLDLFNYVEKDILAKRAPGPRCRLNGRDAPFSAELRAGDEVVIG